MAGTPRAPSTCAVAGCPNIESTTGAVALTNYLDLIAVPIQVAKTVALLHNDDRIEALVSVVGLAARELFIVKPFA